jgi:uncharacterized protein (DUF433 family)
MYGFAEADHLAGASKGTARRWLQGYSYARGAHRISQPPVTQGKSAIEAASFLDLVEVVAIARLKEVGFSLRSIRTIVGNCQEILGVERPLSALKFKTDGRDVFIDRGDSLLEVGLRKRMTAWNEVLAPFLEELDYRADWVERWWPLGKDRPIVVDPDYGFGLPVVAGSGVRTEIIYERMKVGDLPEQIAEDFNLTSVDVSRAIQFEASRAA